MLAKAYRIIPVHQKDHQLLSMLWEDALFVGTALPFALCSAPKIFNAVADTLEWMAGQEEKTSLFHYLNQAPWSINSAGTIQSVGSACGYR